MTLLTENKQPTKKYPPWNLILNLKFQKNVYLNIIIC